MSSKSKKGGSGYFSTTKKGELRELQDDLVSNNKTQIKESVKKIIAAMTIGKDVSMLFPSVIKSMGTDDIELKKLVYLYIINYARSQPEKVILVVNMFQKDANNHPNPLVRALAIRTMGCIRVESITEYLCDPLVKALKDRDPYVRKTAAIGVAKLYDINASLVEERGMIESLRDMISDINPMVVANAVAALAEICQSSGVDYFKMHTNMLSKLLTALQECTEWGKVFILDALAKFEGDTNQSKDILERVVPQLQNNNSAVVMSTIKVIIKNLGIFDSKTTKFKNARDLLSKYYKKLAPALVTLVNNTQPEIQYVSLRNILLIIQKHPSILKNNVRVFYVKFNDPPYIKKEKLDILVKLSSRHNITSILLELKEYAQEIDVEFVRKAVRAIGRIAIKLPEGAEQCVSVLSELIKTGVNYVVQEAVVVIKDIFRRYPNKYEKIILILCENLDSLDEPEAKASMIWILGEYAERIVDCEDRLEYFVETFEEESNIVQLQILTATVKLFLKKPNKSKDLVQKVLNLATEKSDNPDLRDRGYVYWRLLSSDPVAAKSVVLAKRPKISSKTFDLDSDYLHKLLDEISNLSSVYHKLPNEFVSGTKTIKFEQHDEDKEDESSSSSTSSDTEEEESEEEEKEEPKKKQKIKQNNQQNYNNNIQQKPQQQPKQEVDLLGDLFGTPTNNNTPQQPQVQNNNNNNTSNSNDIFGEFDFTNDNNNNKQQTEDLPDMNSVLLADMTNGLNMDIGFRPDNNGKITMFVKANNSGQTTITRIDFKFNKNYLGIGPENPTLQLNGSITPGNTQICKLSLIPNKVQSTQDTSNYDNKVQMAVRSVRNDGNKPPVHTFFVNIPGELFYKTHKQLVQTEYLNKWKALTGNDNSCMIKKLNNFDQEFVKQLLAKNNLVFMAPRVIPNKGVSLYYSVMLNDALVYAEISVANNGACRIVCRSDNKYLAFLVSNQIKNLLA